MKLDIFRGGEGVKGSSKTFSRFLSFHKSHSNLSKSIVHVNFRTNVECKDEK